MDAGLANPSPRALVVAGALAALAMGLAGLNPYLPGGGDNADYIAEAEALAAQGRRVQLQVAGHPPADLRPPLFPLLLTPIVKVWGRNVWAMKALLVFFAAGSVLAAWWLLRIALEGEAQDAGGERGASASRTAAWLAFGFALSPTLGRYAHDVLADVPFTFCALLAMGCTARAARRDARWWRLLPLCAALAAATLLRSAGILVSGACLAYLLWEALRRRGREEGRGVGLRALGLLVFTGLLYLYIRLGTPGYQRYLSGEAGWGFAALPWPQRLLGNVRYYVNALPAELTGWAGVEAQYPLPFLGVVLAGTGAVSFFRGGRLLIPVVFLAYQGAMLLWPYRDARFFLPILPLFLALCWEGGRVLLKRAAERSVYAGGLAAFVLLLYPALNLLVLGYGLFNPEVEYVPAFDGLTAAALLGVGLGALSYVQAKKDAPAAVRGRRLQGVCVGLFLLLASARSVTENVLAERARGPAPEGEGWQDLYDASQWLKEHARPGEAVVSAKVSLVWFWSGLEGLSIPNTTASAPANAQIAGAQWMILDGLREDRAAERFLAPLVARSRESWAPAWRQGQTLILRRVEALAP